MTGPLDFFTTSKSADIVAPSLGPSASFLACWARASGVQVLPVITAAAPMTALRIRNFRRSTPAGVPDSAGAPNSPSSLAEFGVFIESAPGWCGPIDSCALQSEGPDYVPWKGQPILARLVPGTYCRQDM